MTTDRVDPTAEQIKAVASPLRIRILRLCHQAEMTNKELAERLDRHPSTTLHHLRTLEAAGLIERVGVRRGKRGALEIPYRSTGLSWRLSFEIPPEGESPMLSAFRQELSEAGNESIAQLTRFYLHLDNAARGEFIGEFLELVEKYHGENTKQADSRHYGGIFVLHRLAGSHESEGDRDTDTGA